MHLSTIIAALAPASLISGYITIHSKQYCGESPRVEVTKWGGNLNSCYNMDGAAAIQFTEVGQPYSWVCNAYTSSNCQGKIVAFSSYTENSECNNSPIGWLYSYKCYIK
ncbi:uncharacterized protein CTRU02_214735 [Colletotrichum truncatum]|uniref:Uncharacterized protein n=1 Tax=Colletotrichum truncatum TaxID=5467 RepID=A0ACC3YFK4_COLTU|nr:uncharacterized protein CTRU02_09682 [Colletotrichum truncatum]KAF6788364.1 hypothetical protein CTRU02_09682 [Colletotrichum truncatum]